MAFYTIEYSRFITTSGVVQVSAKNEDEAYSRAEYLIKKQMTNDMTENEEYELDIVSIVNDDGEELE